MKTKPILFNTEMVNAILDGTKTVTRRVIKRPPHPDMPENRNYCKMPIWIKDGIRTLHFMDVMEQHPFRQMRYFESFAPYDKGDILYVRETWREYGGKYYYKADECPDYDSYCTKRLPSAPKWHPSIHMPKEAVRIWLKVTDVRVERLQDITEEQTELEGFDFTPPCLSQVSEDSYCDLDGPCTSKVKYCDMSAGELFGKVLWDSTIKKKYLPLYGWDANPWVWVIEFERTVKP